MWPGWPKNGVTVNSNPIESERKVSAVNFQAGCEAGTRKCPLVGLKDMCKVETRGCGCVVDAVEREPTGDS